MGEWSKSIGEKGELINKFIFEEILGVNSLVEGTPIDCVNSEKHRRKDAKAERSTHGLDGHYYLESPVEDELLDIVITSSKYVDTYPKYPKSLFKDHMKDLAFTLECFKYSKLRNEINQKFNTVSKTDLTGILVWLSNSDSEKFDLISKIDNSILDSELEFEKIIVVDNSRVTFLYESIYKNRLLYDKVEFVYHNSSLNNVSINKQAYGSKFPINYIYSDIIAIRVEKNKDILFLIYVNDNFSEDDFSQILSFAKSFDYLNTTYQTHIKFLDYNQLSHEKIAKSVLSGYDNYRLGENLIVSKFPSDFRN